MSPPASPSAFRGIVLIAVVTVMVGGASVGYSAAALAAGTDVSVQHAVASVAIVQTETATGTAFAVSADTLITAAHVVHGAQDVTVRIGGKVQKVQVSATSTRLDLATLSLPAGGLHPLVLRSAPPQLGETVYAAGAALGGDLSLTRGIVSGHRKAAGFSHVQTDASINPGNSGGPLLDEDGNVLGVVVSKLRNAEGMALAVSAADAAAFLHARVVTSPIPRTDPSTGASAAPARRTTAWRWGTATLLLPVLGVVWLVASRPRRLRITLHPRSDGSADTHVRTAKEGIPWQH